MDSIAIVLLVICLSQLFLRLIIPEVFYENIFKSYHK